MMLTENKLDVRMHVSFMANLGTVSLFYELGFLDDSRNGSVLSRSNCKRMFRYSAQDRYRPLSHTTMTSHCKFCPLGLLTTVAILSMHWVTPPLAGSYATTHCWRKIFDLLKKAELEPAARQVYTGSMIHAQSINSSRVTAQRGLLFHASFILC